MKYKIVNCLYTCIVYLDANACVVFEFCDQENVFIQRVFCIATHIEYYPFSEYQVISSCILSNNSFC